MVVQWSVVSLDTYTVIQLSVDFIQNLYGRAIVCCAIRKVHGRAVVCGFHSKFNISVRLKCSSIAVICGTLKV